MSFTPFESEVNATTKELPLLIQRLPMTKLGQWMACRN